MQLSVRRIHLALAIPAVSLALTMAIVYAIRPPKWLTAFRCGEVDWSRIDPDSMTGKQVMEYFAWSNRSSCRLAHDFGGRMMKNPSGLDGQKAVCIDPEVAPRAGKCLVYSFGIDNEWSFDETMERYGCRVFAFDPSMDKRDHDHTTQIHFYNMGLSHRDETNMRSGWKLRTLASIHEMLRPRHGNVPIDYLKIDIEANEWDVLPQLVESGTLAKVRQLGVEIHLPADGSLEKVRRLARIVRALEDNGMIRFDSKANPWYIGYFKHFQYSGSMGYEIAWYNSRISQY